MLEDTLRQMREQCLGKNQSLPASCYTSEAMLALERERIFSSGWVCLGHGDEIPAPGDYFTTSLLSEPLVVVRDDENQIRVMSNVCRHRGMQVAQGAGNANRFRCPYHAWTYNLDGRLRNAPMMAGAVEKSDCRLPSVRSECWGGFIFANLDPRAEALSPQLVTLADELAHYHIALRYHLQVFEEQWDCNWKCLVENFMDGYHLSVVHPQSLKPLTPTNLCKKFTGGSAYTGYNAHYPESAPPREGGHPDLTAQERRQSRLFCIYPSLVVSVSADATAWLAMQPAGVDKVSVRWGLATAQADLTDEQKRGQIEKWQEINAEDHAILEKLQVGLQSAMFAGGALAPADLEGTVSEFHDYLIARLTQ
jgi:phenylpropionate dioxygenase-like ring-hydroxylating dioxygenase large terminal subunit